MRHSLEMKTCSNCIGSLQSALLQIAGAILLIMTYEYCGDALIAISPREPLKLTAQAMLCLLASVACFRAHSLETGRHTALPLGVWFLVGVFTAVRNGLVAIESISSFAYQLTVEELPGFIGDVIASSHKVILANYYLEAAVVHGAFMALGVVMVLFSFVKISE